MESRWDISDILRSWPHEPGTVVARLIAADDGRELLQMRVDMGLLQMETTGRPDGARFDGEATYLDWLRAREQREGSGTLLSEEECAEADREFLQFYQRRICWLALREFPRAVSDADHTLALMDFVRESAADAEWVEAHEQYRAFVLFHRIQAAAFGELEHGGPEPAIEQIHRGLEQLRQLFAARKLDEQYGEDEMVGQLVQLKEWLRREYRLGRTLAEQLADAVAAEQYERAAALRDQIARRKPHKA